MPKKNGKSTLAAMIACHAFFCGEDMGEIYLAAADKDQAAWITYKKVWSAIRMNRTMHKRAAPIKDGIENKETGTILRVLPCDVSAAGLNPSLVIFDELWTYTHSRRRGSIPPW
jgi:phage terminase large subunit-like protein